MGLNAATVCSGIGAPETAMPEWQWQFCAEIEPFPSAVLAHHYPNVPNFGDMTRFKEWPDATIDVLVGGTPCQSFSVAGLRKGLDDPRGNLALVFLALADRYRPEWVVWENVPGVLSSNAGRDFGAFLGGLGELGYGWAYRCLDAQWFGLAQRRKRVFVVGHLGDWRRAAAVLFEPEGLRGDSAPSREAGEGITPILEAGARTGVSTSDPRAGIGIGEDGDPMFSLQAGKQHAVAFGGNNTAGPIDCATAVNAHGGPSGRMDFESETFIAFSCKDHGADALTDLSPTLRAGGHDRSHANAGVMPAVTVALRGREGGGVAEMGGDIATALRASQGGGDKPHVLQTAVRRLTPVECCRLMGFPDDYLLQVTWRGKRPPPDGPMYKSLGNSQGVPVMRWILRRIELAHAVTEYLEAAE